MVEVQPGVEDVVAVVCAQSLGVLTHRSRWVSFQGVSAGI